MIKIKRNCKEIEGKSFGARKVQKQGKTGVCEISQPLRNRHFAAKPFHSLRPLSVKIFTAAKPLLAYECHFEEQWPSFCSCEITKRKNSQFRSQSSISQGISQLRNAKPLFGTQVPFGIPIHSFRSCEMVAKSSCLKILQRAYHEQTCHSRTPIGHI